MNIIHNLTETDCDNINVNSQLEVQSHFQETQESGRIIGKNNSMKISFLKTGEINGSSYVTFLLRSNAILNKAKDNNFPFIWSLLAQFHPRKDSHPKRVKNYRQNLNESNIEGVDFSCGFRCSDVPIFENLNNSSINIFELIFYQDQNEWTHSLIPMEFSKNESDRVVDLLIHKNHYSFINKIHVFFENHIKIFV